MTTHWRTNIAVIREALLIHDGTDPLRAREALDRLESGFVARQKTIESIMAPAREPHESDDEYGERLIVNALSEYLKPGLGLDLGVSELGSRALEAWNRLRARPVALRLPCERCGQLHIDVGEFATKPHHTHSCQHCGLSWRPAKEHTVGVMFIPGFKNAEPPATVPKSPGFRSQEAAVFARAFGLKGHTGLTSEGLGSQANASTATEPRCLLKAGDWVAWKDRRALPFRVRDITGDPAVPWVVSDRPERRDRALIDPSLLEPWIPKLHDRVVIKAHGINTKIDSVSYDARLFHVTNPANGRGWFALEELEPPPGPIDYRDIIDGSRWRYRDTWTGTARWVRERGERRLRVTPDGGQSSDYLEANFRDAFTWVSNP